MTMAVIAHAMYFAFIAVAVAFGGMVLARPGTSPNRRLEWLLYSAAILLPSAVVLAALVGEPLQALIFATIGFGAFVLTASALRDWDVRGHAFFASFVAALLLFLVHVQTRILSADFPLLGDVLSWILFVLEAASAALSIFYAYEVLNVTCRHRWRRAFVPITFPTGYYPKVSIHVPAHAEPVEMVKQTLAALSKLDYPNYEVIMVDDNTTHSELWQPLMDYCKELGFKVFHLLDYPGFKSGALNFALTQTARDAEIIAVVDSDYIVEPNYLKETVPYFQNPAVAFVQTPQSFRNVDGFRFRAASALAQRFFFEIGMRSRNERNSIIFCGTMGMIRKTVLQRIGGWSEWCITEDAETSLRILRLGYDSVYINKAYGTGLLPETFEDLKKQRFRWAFGGIQILRRYWRELLSLDTEPASRRLTPAQRLDYFMGFMGWFNDLLILAFTAFVFTTAISYAFDFTLPVRTLLSWALMLPILAIVTGSLRVAWALRLTTGCSWRDGLGAFLSMLSLSWTVALACVSAIIHKRGVFLRTPKLAGQSDLGRALRVTLWESVLGTSLIVAVLLLLNVTFTVESVLLATLLVWHALVYLSALRTSLTEGAPL
jgi:cellulose synthase/poly-beta-1,6-N-acetylglucosamine synthase-like glycosyltransferase